MAITSIEFLEIALSRAPTPEEVDELLTSRVEEDLSLEYKRGRWLSEKKPAPELRRYVAGFANAEGGVLLVGVAGGEEKQQDSDKQWAVDGCPPSSKRSWTEWAADALSPITGYFSRMPRVHSVSHAAGEVIVVAIIRSHGLVPCVEEGRPVHYMRIGHEAQQVPPYLYADLVLGRRQSPQFSVELKPPSFHERDPIHIGLRVRFIARNESLVWVPDLQIGIVGMGSMSPEPPTMRCDDGNFSGVRTLGEPQIPAALSSYVDVLARRRGVLAFVVRSPSRPPLTTAPFAGIVCDALFALPVVDKPQRTGWKGAIYIAPTNGLPQWFAVNVEYDSELGPSLPNTTDYDAPRSGEARIPIRCDVTDL